MGNLVELPTKFKAPFTIEQFHEDIGEVLLHYMRVYASLIDADTPEAFKAFGLSYEEKETPSLFYNSELSATKFGIMHEKTKNMTFAQTLERMYQFAYEGRIDSTFESMNDESCFTFVSALVVDACSSEYLEEWILRGSWAAHSIGRCVQVAELANARNILEGGESYFNRFPPSGHLDSMEGLTIRQMALLAGMEEMSIRAAANPKRANPLKTVSNADGTHITLADAKQWLQSKGLYVPVTYYFKENAFDMKIRGFKDTNELYDMLQTRFRTLAEEHGRDEMSARISEAVGKDIESIYSISYDQVQDPVFLEKLAVILDLPVTLLQLRVGQVYAAERLRIIGEFIEEEISKS